MKLNTYTETKVKETKTGDITTIETNTTIFVAPVCVKTTYSIKENNNESNNPL